MTILNRILELKSKLYLNGDWLFVTEEIPKQRSAENLNDITIIYSKFENVINNIRLTKISDLKNQFDEAKEYYENTIERGAVARDKAKVLLSAGSFVSAVIMGILSQLSQLKETISINSIVFISIPFFLSSIHLIRSLYLSTKAITREEYISISPPDIVEVNPKSYLKSPFYKDRIAKYISYACTTQNFVRTRTNLVILAQEAFIYGLFFFALSIFCLLIAFYSREKKEVIQPNQIITTIEIKNNSYLKENSKSKKRKK